MDENNNMQKGDRNPMIGHPSQKPVRYYKCKHCLKLYLKRKHLHTHKKTVHKQDGIVESATSTPSPAKSHFNDIGNILTEEITEQSDNDNQALNGILDIVTVAGDGDGDDSGVQVQVQAANSNPEHLNPNIDSESTPSPALHQIGNVVENVNEIEVELDEPCMGQDQVVAAETELGSKPNDEVSTGEEESGTFEEEVNHDNGSPFQVVDFMSGDKFVGALQRVPSISNEVEIEDLSSQNQNAQETQSNFGDFEKYYSYGSSSDDAFRSAESSIRSNSAETHTDNVTASTGSDNFEITPNIIEATSRIIVTRVSDTFATVGDLNIQRNAPSLLNTSKVLISSPSPESHNFNNDTSADDEQINDAIHLHHTIVHLADDEEVNDSNHTIIHSPIVKNQKPEPEDKTYEVDDYANVPIVEPVRCFPNVEIADQTDLTSTKKDQPEVSTKTKEKFPRRKESGSNIISRCSKEQETATSEASENFRPSLRPVNKASKQEESTKSTTKPNVAYRQSPQRYGTRVTRNSKLNLSNSSSPGEGNAPPDYNIRLRKNSPSAAGGSNGIVTPEALPPSPAYNFRERSSLRQSTAERLEDNNNNQKLPALPVSCVEIKMEINSPEIEASGSRKRKLESTPTLTLPDQISEVSDIVQITRAIAKKRPKKPQMSTWATKKNRKKKARGRIATHCSYCAVMLDETSRSKPIQIGHTEVPVSCATCVTKYGDYRIRLIKQNFGEIRYGCSQCRKDFITRSALISHFHVHTGEKRIVVKQEEVNKTPTSTNSIANVQISDQGASPSSSSRSAKVEKLSSNPLSRLTRSSELANLNRTKMTKVKLETTQH